MLTGHPVAPPALDSNQCARAFRGTPSRPSAGSTGRNVVPSVHRLPAGHRRRLFRFAITGGLAGAIQLALLTAFTHGGWHAIPANMLAFVLAAQVNFAMSGLFTWRDRRTSLSWPRRWLLFHCSIAGMAVFNMLVFAVVRLLLPDLLASAIGIAAAAGNFILGDLVVFRARLLPQAGERAAAQEPAA
jgi:putative flippase GtrA